MVRRLLGSSGLLTSMSGGTLWPLVQAFKDHLTEFGHTAGTVADVSNPARHLAVWLDQCRIKVTEIDGGLVERFLSHQCQCIRQSPASRWSMPLSVRGVRDLRRFLRFLSACGMAPMFSPSEMEAKRSEEVIDADVAMFLSWLRDHCGSSDATIAIYRHWILRARLRLGTNPARYEASSIRSLVIEAAERYSPNSVSIFAKVLRGYLRFLATRGECAAALVDAVPTVAKWHLSSLPRYLSQADVEKVIASCDLSRPAGIRDHAVLLLLARLGLRAGDIWMMRLGNIDWEAGTLRVCGKGRREARLPLPQDAGDALLAYLDKARPRVDSDRVFLRSRPPFQPFETAIAVSHLVRRSVDRAGVSGVHSRGAHLLRHSAATAWLRAGATLDAVGTILRHRSTDTTAHYAKVDFAALKQIAQPWPGDLPC